MSDDSETKTSDCKCVICGDVACGFYPLYDSEMPSHVYCRHHLDKTKNRVLENISNQLYNSSGNILH